MTAPSTAVPEGSPPPTLSPGGRTALRALLIAVACAAVAGLVVSLAGLAWGVSRFRVVADTLALPATLRAVAVDTGSVPVAIRITSDRDATQPRVDMRMVSATRAGSEPLTLSEDGSTARVSIESESSPLLHWGRAGEITLVLPPEMARGLTVTTTQQMGVVFAEADIDQLVAKTSEGAVVLSGSARRIEITNSHGDVRTRAAISVTESFRAVTETGDISVDFAAAPQTVDAETGHGDVAVAVAGPGPFVVDASTGRERSATVIRVPQTRNADEATAVITARSDDGDVLVDALR